MVKCPCCGGQMETDDPQQASYVADGIAVCSAMCHDDIVDVKQLRLPVTPQFALGPIAYGLFRAGKVN